MIFLWHISIDLLALYIHDLHQMRSLSLLSLRRGGMSEEGGMLSFTAELLGAVRLEGSKFT